MDAVRILKGYAHPFFSGSVRVSGFGPYFSVVRLQMKRKKWVSLPKILRRIKCKDLESFFRIRVQGSEASSSLYVKGDMKIRCPFP